MDYMDSVQWTLIVGYVFEFGLLQYYFDITQFTIQKQKFAHCPPSNDGGSALGY